MKKVLWKYDDEDGIIYVCPTCKTYVCGWHECDNCGEQLQYTGGLEEYTGTVNYC